jgi:predicted N-acetyltransferase YhbS
MWDIRAEGEDDGPAVERLVIECFGAGRFAKTAYRLREGVDSDQRLSFVAEERETGEILGSVRFWPIAVAGGTALLLGPLAVRPAIRGKGVGIKLMQRGLSQAKALGYAAVILVGDESYYAKVGFARLKPGQIRFPGPVDPARVLGLALKPGSLEGLSGEIKRARIDHAVSAQATPLG